MGTSILKQSQPSPPSPDVVEGALQLLREEREQIEALAIALTDRMTDAERGSGGSSTELLLAQMLNERLSDTYTLKYVENLLKGAAA
jgi:hypothetical protein